MALKDTISNMKNLLNKIQEDLPKAENENKAASQRIRTNTIRLEKIAKLYRKESIKYEKQNKGKKKTAKKPAAKKSAKNKSASAQKKNVNNKMKKKSSAKPLSLRKPSAGLRRTSMR